MSNGLDLGGLLKVALASRWSKTIAAALILIFFAAWGYDKFIEPAFDDPAEVEIPKSELMQLKEIRHHSMEDPLWKKELVADNGKPGKQYYFKDMCSQTAWKHLFETTEGKVVEGTVVKIVFHPSRLFDLEVMAAGIFAQTAEEDCPSPEECRCLDPWEHPGESVTIEVQDEENLCLIWYWNEWPDLCRAYQRFDWCADEWIDEEPQWACCSCDHGKNN